MKIRVGNVRKIIGIKWVGMGEGVRSDVESLGAVK